MNVERSPLVGSDPSKDAEKIVSALNTASQQHINRLLLI